MKRGVSIVALKMLCLRLPVVKELSLCQDCAGTAGTKAPSIRL
jgi:hypothetical protein